MIYVTSYKMFVYKNMYQWWKYCTLVLEYLTLT